ncbi:hypothetical protein [Natronolimnobius baerhuensis]|uniref:Uncharacterized protein n=1 Tax=Natronolimnobius baerhuensis TaxID=253108 RepID=A0A202E3J4_9EURY|nr:hypothetical protein [Natronolimnobius baerhuensis]OVE82863.1 hypothetical protein B2G88_18965 [Natronolimnobius baerhuensis]
MGEPDDLPGSEPGQVVERDETYEHDDFGLVEVTGIWRGIPQVDSARHTDQKDGIIVRYSTKEDDTG